MSNTCTFRSKAHLHSIEIRHQEIFLKVRGYFSWRINKNITGFILLAEYLNKIHMRRMSFYLYNFYLSDILYLFKSSFLDSSQALKLTLTFHLDNIDNSILGNIKRKFKKFNSHNIVSSKIQK